MRTRALVVIALLTLPAGLTAQAGGGIRLPRGRTPTQQPAPLPPSVPIVNQALAYKRSRWSSEAYSLITNFQVPTAVGADSKHTFVGAGTRADYRYSDHLSATVDITASTPGSADNAETVELGTRYSPLTWERRLRPYFDVRAGYMRMYNTFLPPAGSTGAIIAGLDQQVAAGGSYSHGFGGLGGLGLEYSLTRTFALTSELSASRNRMTTFPLSGSTNIPTGTNYWMTSYRYTLGLKFNPVRSLHLAQNPTQ